MTYQGIIFDFNGVLWWDSQLQAQAWRQFAHVHTGHSLTDADINTHVHGRTNRHTFEYLLQRSLTAAEVADLIQRKEGIYRQLCLEQGTGFRLSPGAVTLLADLQARRIPHTIATASEKSNLDFFFAHLDLQRWFDPAQVVYDDGTRPGKPAPDVYLQATRNLALPPAACVVVEDSRSGIEAARRAGIGCIVALGPAATHPQLRQTPGVGQVIASLTELPALNLL